MKNEMSTAQSFRFLEKKFFRFPNGFALEHFSLLFYDFLVLKINLREIFNKKYVAVGPHTTVYQSDVNVSLIPVRTSLSG